MMTINSQIFLKVFAIAVTWILTIIIAATITINAVVTADNPLSKFSLSQTLGKDEYSKLERVEYDGTKTAVYYFTDGSSQTITSTDNGFILVK